MGEVAFALQALLGQNVALEGVFAFDFPCSGKSESFFGTGISLDFWHVIDVLNELIHFLDFGESIMIIFLRSMTGSESTFAISAKSLARRNSSISPCSLKRIERPLKKT